MVSTNEVVIFLDPVPPANPVLVVNGGVGVTGVLVVNAQITSGDANAGDNDVTSMLIWGDVDPTIDPSVQPLQINSQWIAYNPNYLIQLSALVGLHTIYAMLRDDVGNVTVAFSTTIVYDPTVPQITISVPLSVGRISITSPFDTTQFGWQSSLAFQAYQIRVVPTPNSPVTAGVAIPSIAGSINVAGNSGLANTTVTTVIKGLDLAIAAPGVGNKIVKAFCQSGGKWSV